MGRLVVYNSISDITCFSGNSLYQGRYEEQVYETGCNSKSFARSEILGSEKEKGG